MTWLALANLLGGLGFFLLGMKMMTEGLQTAAGSSLQAILSKWTKTRWRGIGSGILITALVHTSGAVTVATIGFVNAGMMTLGQAVAVIYGTNVGTTATGWLVAAVGFQWNLKVFALPLVGIGVAFGSVARRPRQQAIGQALLGCGLFFVGLDLFKATFGGLASSLPLQTFQALGVAAPLVFLLVGALLTFLMQSSTATMALALTAVGQGFLPTSIGAALIIGANIGTTSTAILVALHASPAAKRVAATHVFFNLLAGSITLLFLHPLLFLLAALRGLFGFSADGVGQLALFHTAFNVLGIALMWPLTDRWLRWLEDHFDSPKTGFAHPRFLDPTLLSSPPFAFRATAQELERLCTQARQIAKSVLSAEDPQDTLIKQDTEDLQSLFEALSKYLHRINQQRLPSELEPLLPKALRVSSYCIEVADLAQECLGLLQRALLPSQADLLAEISRYRASIVAFLDASFPTDSAFPPEDRKAAFLRLQVQHEAIKQRLLREGVEGRFQVRKLVQLLEILSLQQQIAQQMQKAALILYELHPSSLPTPSLPSDPKKVLP